MEVSKLSHVNYSVLFPVYSLRNGGTDLHIRPHHKENIQRMILFLLCLINIFAVEEMLEKISYLDDSDMTLVSLW